MYVCACMYACMDIQSLYMLCAMYGLRQIWGLSYTNLGTKLCITVLGLAAQSLDCNQWSVQIMDWQTIQGLLGHPIFWLHSRKHAKCGIKLVLPDYCRKWKVMSCCLNIMLTLIVNTCSALAHVQSVFQAGMAQGKRNLFPLLGSLLVHCSWPLWKGKFFLIQHQKPLTMGCR